MKLKGILALLCATALTAACSNTRDTTRADDSVITDRDSTVGTTGTADRVQNADRDFVRELTEAGNAEVQLGKLASERAASASVKQFAQMLVKDHTAAGDKLRQIATTHNLSIGDVGVDAEHSKLMTTLSPLKGAEFDREFISAMVDGHENVVDKLQTRVDERDRVATALWREEKDVNVKAEPSDNALKASVNQWAADSLPVVKGHLEKAKGLNDTLKRGSNTASR